MGGGGATYIKRPYWLQVKASWLWRLAGSVWPNTSILLVRLLDFWSPWTKSGTVSEAAAVQSTGFLLWADRPRCRPTRLPEKTTVGTYSALPQRWKRSSRHQERQLLCLILCFTLVFGLYGRQKWRPRPVKSGSVKALRTHFWTQYEILLPSLFFVFLWR